MATKPAYRTMSTIPDADRRNFAAIVSVTALLAVVYVLVPHPIAQYGVWLTIFTIWMVWFVASAVEWISRADF